MRKGLCIILAWRGHGSWPEPPDPLTLKDNASSCWLYVLACHPNRPMCAQLVLHFPRLKGLADYLPGAFVVATVNLPRGFLVLVCQSVKCTLTRHCLECTGLFFCLTVVVESACIINDIRCLLPI